MNDKNAENVVEKAEDVDELSIIRQVKARLDKLPDLESKERVLNYVAQQLSGERQRRYQAEVEKMHAAKMAGLASADFRDANGASSKYAV